MSIRPPLLLCLCLLAAPLAAEPLRSGAMRLRLSAAGGVPLLQHGADPVARLCVGHQTPEVIFKDNSSTCRAKVLNGQPKNKGGGPPPATTEPFLQLDILAIETAGDGALRAGIFARALAWSDPRPIETPCGRFTWSLRLDPRAIQPVSKVTLQPGFRDASRGTLSGELQMTAQLRFDSTEQDRRLIIPLSLRLALDGSWAATRLGDPNASNVLFFADRPGCARLRPLAGRICLSPGPEGETK